MQDSFTKSELNRYSRHLIMPEVGLEGQLKLKSSKVLVVGAGGLGSPALLYLAAAGVGVIGIVDFDDVDDSNLHRQIIHGHSDIGKSKLDSAIEKLKEINPYVELKKFETKITSENALQIIQRFDLVVDGTDNFPTRYLINDACVLLEKPNVYGSIFKFDGQVTVFAQKEGPCYRCLYPEPPPPGTVPNCAEGGVLGILPGVIGCLQATEAVKIILGIGDSLVGRLVLYDALSMQFRELKIKRDPDCPICGDHPTIRELVDYESFCGIKKRFEKEVSAKELEAKLKTNSDFVLIDVREPEEYELDRIEGSILIPLGSLQSRMNEIDSKKEIVVHCRSGARSSDACYLLQSAGYQNVSNLKGGILEWNKRNEI